MLDDDGLDALVRERRCDRPAHPAPADDHGAVRCRRLPRVARVVRGELLGGAGQDQHRRLGQHRVGGGDREGAAAPHTDDAHAEPLAQLRLGERPAQQIGAHRARLGDLQAGELADHVAVAREPERARRHRRAEDLAELHDVVGAGDLEDVDRGRRVRAGHDLHVRCDLAHGERDVGVDLVGLGGDDERRLVDASIAVGGGIVERSDHHVATLVVDETGFGDVVDDQHVRHVGLVGPLDERSLDRPELGEDADGPTSTPAAPVALDADRVPPSTA